MCGVVVVMRHDGERVSPTRLGRMASTLHHRGPDAAGWATLGAGAVGMAHTRLSILDIQNGHQPMIDGETGVAVVFNGEIYDEDALREELITQGQAFATRSDTEVLLRLYLAHGTEMFRYLRGEFAFVIWDPRTRTLLAARDPVGIKPLFIARGEGMVGFASEWKALLAHPDVPRRLRSLYFYANLAGVSDPTVTLWDAVEGVPPGGYVVVDDQGQTTTHTWWSPPLDGPRFDGSFEEAVEAVSAAFRRAVRRRLRADVPVGVYLSGGLDSTAVLATMVDQGARPTAFHLSFPGESVDERSVAEESASYLGVPIEVVSCRPERLVDELEDTIWHDESPVANLHAVAKRALSEGVRDHGTKVCLTGEGSDEVFAGYPHFKLEAIWRAMDAGGPSAVDAEALLERFVKEEHATRNLIWSLPRGWRRAPRPYGARLYFEMHVRRMRSMVQWMLRGRALGMTSQDLPDTRLAQLHPHEVGRGLAPLDMSRRLSMNALSTYVLPLLGDRAEMAHSVECRTPFLDQDVIELGCRMPERYLLDLPGLRGKRVLKDALSPILPPHMHTRNKAAFVAPRWSALRRTARGRELLGDHLSHASVVELGVLRPSFVCGLRAAWSLLPEGTNASEMMDGGIGVLLSVQILLRHFLVGPRPGRDDYTMVERMPLSA